jgi:DNA invertase Pin-like site-specific DNA recombinase
MKRRVIGLLRVSTNAQDLERQRVDLARVVATHQLELVRTVELDGVSGRKVQDDPQFQKVLLDMKRADIAGIAVSANDRIVRPEKFIDLQVFDPFKDNKKLIFSAKEGVQDPASDAGWMMAFMGGAQAGMEWRELRRRTLQGKEVKRRQGQHVNGRLALPRGVAYDKATGWHFTEPDRSRIEKAYDLLFRGLTYREISREIGGGWSGSGLMRALKNPIWRGVRSYGTATKASEQRREEAIEVPVPLRLLSDERWEQAQQIMRGRKAKWLKHQRPESPFLAMGLLKCNCGKPYFTRTDYRQGQHHAYYCSSRYPKGSGCGTHPLWQTEVDPRLVRWVREHLLDPHMLFAMSTASLDQIAKFQGKGAAAKLARELAKLDGKRRRFVEMRGDGVISRDELAKRLAALDRERSEVEALMPEETPTVEPEALVSVVATHLAEFPLLQFSEQRDQLRVLIKEFRLRDGAITGFEFAPGFLAGIAHTKALPHCSVSQRFRVSIQLPKPFILQAVA